MKKNAQTPPRWAESLLERLSPSHAQDEIVGDLREEYIESMLPRHGRLRANAWYVRQVLSFLPRALRESREMGMLLIGSSVFTTTCMLWLACMELVLRHPLYVNRMALDLAFALLCVATVIVRLFTMPQTLSEICLRAVSLILILYGANTFFGNARAAHFEGFVFVISLALMLQGVLMLLTLGRTGESKPRQPAR